jgi:murein DD-endopeptidase MepM/ murein hydrolase activator NlpD
MGAPLALATELGIGSRRIATKMLLEGPTPELVAQVSGHESDTLLWPVPEGRLWRGFGYVRTGRARRKLHKGIDIGAAEGSLIRSVNDGLVIYADNEVRGYGNLMMVLHPDGSVAFYAHARRLYLFAGQEIERGQVLGEVGHTGIAHGDHLHFELRVRGRPRNPLRRMVGRGDLAPGDAT